MGSQLRRQYCKVSAVLGHTLWVARLMFARLTFVQWSQGMAHND